MAKYNKKTVKRICGLVEKDSYTIAEICTSVGISERCFYDWQKNNAEFAEKLKEAKERFVNKRLMDCEKSLVKLINGYDYDEKKTVAIDDGQGSPKVKEQTITKKHVAPNLGAIIHFQTNKDPDNWRNRQSTELSGKVDVYSKLTDEELEKRIAELEKKVK